MNIYDRKIRAIAWLLLGLMVLQGCTQYHAVDINAADGLVEEINEKGKTSRSKVILKDGQVYEASKLYVGPHL
jgi:hypothetical protein